MKTKLLSLILFLLFNSFLSFSQNILGDDIVACEGDTVTLNAQYDSAVSYQWFLQGQALNGATQATYNVTQVGNYSVEIVLANGEILTDSIVVEFASFPDITQPTPLEVCDSYGDGYGVFDLSEKNDEITNGDINVIVTYHISEDEAQQNIGALSMPFYNEINPQTVYVRVENYNGCFAITTLDLIVLDYVSITEPTDYIVCAENSNEDDNYEITEFDLTTKDAEITGGQTDLIITYFQTLQDAYSLTNPIANPNSYTNVSNPQEIFARAENQNTGCGAVTSFNLFVQANQAPDNLGTLFGCEDDSDGIASFNLIAFEGITAYYETLVDAQNSTNAITTPENYSNITNPQTIYVTTDDNVYCSSTISEIELVVNSNPNIVTSANSLEGCANENNFATYDLTINEAQILNGLDPNSNSLFYYLTESDAQYNYNPIATPSQFLNSSNPQMIFVRVNNNQTTCYSIASFSLLLNPAPEVNQNVQLSECDEDDDGLINFDLTTIIGEILNGQTDVNLTFHENQSDAENATNVIGTNIETSDDTTIYARAENNVTGCFIVFPINLEFQNCPVTVICEEEPVNTTYCYGNYDNTEFVFTSADSSNLIVQFNEGEVEYNFDYLVVYDSDGTELYHDDGNDGDLTGLTFQSSGDTITVAIDSDSIFNCETHSYTSWDFDVFCASSARVIDISAFLDENSNTAFDSTENLFSQGYFTYQVNGGDVNTVNSSTGNFFLLSDNDTDVYDFTFNLYEEYQNCNTVTVASISDISVSQGETVSVDFPVVSDISCEDLAVYVINYWAPPRPGFYRNNYLVLENTGFVPITSGTVEFETDDLLEYISASINDSSITITDTANGFTVDFTNLQPGESKYIIVELYCPTDVDLGTIVTNTAIYTTTENDMYEPNNSSSLSEEVVGSWDPNDKAESHGPRVLYDDFVASDQYLYYTIRFQNLGTAEAITVRIEDELDAQLDVSTFRMLRSSHDYVVTQTGNQLTWQFDDINLPAEQDDAEGSNGFVYFKIKPNPGFELDDIIPNTAAIYFDFNEPVITNTFETEFVEEQLSLNLFNTVGFELYPNPASELVTLNFKEETNAHITIYNLQGKQIFNEKKETLNKSINLDISAFSDGVYFMKVNVKGKELIKKLIKN